MYKLLFFFDRKMIFFVSILTGFKVMEMTMKRFLVLKKVMTSCFYFVRCLSPEHRLMFSVFLTLKMKWSEISSEEMFFLFYGNLQERMDSKGLEDFGISSTSTPDWIPKDRFDDIITVSVLQVGGFLVLMNNFVFFCVFASHLAQSNYLTQFYDTVVSQSGRVPYSAVVVFEYDKYIFGSSIYIWGQKLYTKCVFFSFFLF